jgi:hypothetical protein
MKTANKRIDKLEAGTKKASKGMGGMSKALAAAGAAAVGTKLLQFGKEVTGLAVAAEEAGSAFATTFGPAIGKADRFVKEFANDAGFAEFELQQLMATTGNIVQGLGATEDVSADLSESMARLAGDVASFSNAAGGAPAVLGALQSALTGEREALKTYGIVINEADVQQQALIETGKEHASELTKLEKAQATMTIAYERAGKAVGDLDRTQDSSANTMRRLEAKFKEAKTTIGKGLLPVLEQLLPVAEDLIPVFEDIGVAVGKTAQILGPAGKAFGEWIDLLFNATERGKKLQRTGSGVDKVLGVMTETFGDLAKAYLPFLQGLDLVDDGMTRQEAVAQAVYERQEELEAQVYETAYAQIIANRATEAGTTAAGDHEDAVQAEAEAIAAAELESWKLERATDAVQEQQRKAASGAMAHRNALKALNDQIRTQTDPLFAVLQAQRNLDEVQSDAEASAEDVAIAQLELDAAQRDLAGSGPDAALGLERINQALIDGNVPLEERVQLMEELNDAMRESQLFGAIGGTVAPPGTIGGTTPGPIGRFDSGGIVPGPIGSPQLAVVHGGETILPTHKDESDTGANITINVTESYNDPNSNPTTERRYANGCCTESRTGRFRCCDHRHTSATQPGSSWRPAGHFIWMVDGFVVGPCQSSTF